MPVDQDSIVLEVNGLSMHLGAADSPVRAVDDVSFKIRKGETFALLGESGCGKSMTAFSIMRLLPPSGRIVGGSVKFEDEELLGVPENRMRRYRGGRIGMIFQEPMTSLNPVMTVGAQIDEALRLHTRLRKHQRHERVLELLNDVGIPDAQGRIDAYPHQLSGGMKQRVMIAIALAGEPELLIADEPTTAVDVTIQAQLLELLRELQRKTGLAIMLITHDLGVVWEMADHIAVMYAGQLVETASRAQFFDRPQHPYSQKLFRALPAVDKRGKRLDAIDGTVPPLTTQFTGCRFADRCEMALKHCAGDAPAWHDAEEGTVRCHLYTDAVPEEQRRLLATKPQDDAPRAGFADSAAGSMLNVEDLQVHFPIQRGVFRRTVGHVRAVDGVSFELRAGRTVALVGESGCGKTTVGKSILRLLEPTGGAVYFNDTDVASLSASALRKKRRDFQIIFQDPFSSMNPRMRVADIISEGMQAQRIGKNRYDREQRSEELLKQVGLNKNALDRYPHEFSGGQRQRICIARALAVSPQLIVCDEPTSALDVSVQAQVLNLLKDLQHERGLSYLFITHDLSVVSYLADDIMVMYLGRIVEQGSVEQVMSSPRHPYTQALLSAVPVIGEDRGAGRTRLEGDLPSPANPPQGCHFHPRCPKAQDVCRRDYPGADDNGGHTVHCHFPLG